MATNYLRKIELGGLHVESTLDATSYVGDKNDIWTDDNAPTTWRIGDGVTPGGVILFSGGSSGGGGITLTDLSVVQTAVGDPTLSYNSTLGVFTYTPPDLTGYATTGSVPTTLTDLGINDGTNGQVLTTDGSGGFTFTTVASGGISYSDLSVTQNASAGLGTLAYNNTTGTFTYTPPVIPTDVSDLTDTTNLLSGGGGIALTDLSVGAEDPASGDGGISYDNTTGEFKYAPPDLSGYQPTSNVTADIDGHLNTSTAGANEVLSWDGADYAWVSNAGGGGTDATTFDGQAPSYYLDYTNFTNTPTIPTDYGDHSTQGYLTSYTETDTLQSVIDRGNTSTTTAVIPFLYADQTAFPNASTYHGAIAHSHSDGAMYFAHGGVWNKLANDSQLSAYLTSYTVTESDVTAHEAALTITESQISDLGSYSTFDGAFGSLTGTPTTIAGYGITDAFDGDYNNLTNQPTIPSALSNIADAGYGVDITGKAALTDGIDIDIGGSINAQACTLDFTTCTVNFSGSNINFGSTVRDEIDTHLNQSGPTDGYVLSWDSSANGGNGDYAWVSNSGGISDTDSLPEGTSNLYYTDARFDARLQTRNISNLADVDTSGASNGQALAWSSSNSQWEPLSLGNTFGLAGNTGTHTFNGSTETLTFLGTTGQINIEVATNFLSLSLDDNIDSIVSIAFEGTTDDAYETKLQAVDPTADNVINLPNASGTVALTSDLTTLDTNTITTSSGNLAISADNYVTIDSDNNGQIEIGVNSGVGDVRIGNEGNGTSIHMEGVTTFEQNAKFDTGVEEKFSTLTGSTGVVAHDCDNGHIFYHTTPAGDITANFTNLDLTAEYATNLTVIINQGATARIVTAVQIGGSAQTINWQGGSAPTGTSNGIDSFSFTILNDGGSYVVLGQMVDFT